MQQYNMQLIQSSSFFTVIVKTIKFLKLCIEFFFFSLMAGWCHENMPPPTVQFNSLYSMPFS